MCKVVHFSTVFSLSISFKDIIENGPLSLLPGVNEVINIHPKSEIFIVVMFLCHHYSTV